MYFPLGGSKKGVVRTYLNIFIVFLLSGLWHGAGWQFVLWGAMHGIAQIIERLFSKIWRRFHPAFSWIICFGFVNITWVFFRAETISQANLLLPKLFRFDYGAIESTLSQTFWLQELKVLCEGTFLENHQNLTVMSFYLIALLAVVGLPNAKVSAEKLAKHKRVSIIIAALFAWCILSLSGKSTFLYFNF